MKNGDRVRITAGGAFADWEAIILQPSPERRQGVRETQRGFWLLVPGHPWQEQWPGQPWHFYAHEFQPVPEQERT